MPGLVIKGNPTGGVINHPPPTPPPPPPPPRLGLKEKKGITITNAFQEIANQTKYGYIKAVSFTADQ